MASTSARHTAAAEPAPAEVRSPALANAVVILGFVLIFTTFVTHSPWSWIIGGVLLVAGALWAGFSSGSRPTTDDADVPPVEGSRAVRHGATPPAEPVAGAEEHGHGHPA